MNGIFTVFDTRGLEVFVNHNIDCIIITKISIIAPKMVIQKWKWSYGLLGFNAAMKGYKIYKI